MTTSPAGTLSERHQKMLFEESAIQPEVAAARGVWTASTPAHRKLLQEKYGFGEYQFGKGQVLVFPYRDAEGREYAQIRPDRPFKKGEHGCKKDRPKYETPAGEASFGLDIPPTKREEVLNSKKELFMTEGVKKNDALVSAGICSVALVGVWNFHRKSPDSERRLPLPDFDTIVLSGRVVVICFDSDVMSKESVYAALKRLSNLLRKKGATVRYCYLPDDGETKIGADDFLALHTVEELRACISDTLKPVATAPVSALIHALNRRCEGIGTFHPKRLEFAGDGGNEGALRALRAMADERGKIDDEFRFWAGDAYNRLDLPYGTKTATLTEVIGPGWTQQIRKWAVVCSAFRGERDYYRHAVSFWFLAEIAGMEEALQDTLLAEHLNEPMNQKRLRERIADITNDTEGEERRASRRTSAGGAKSGELLSLLLMRMRAEDRALIEEIERQQGAQVIHEVIARLFPDALHYLATQVKAWSEYDDVPMLYMEDTSSPPPIYNRDIKVDAEPEDAEPAGDPLIAEAKRHIRNLPDELPPQKPAPVEATSPPLDPKPESSSQPPQAAPRRRCYRCHRDALGTPDSPNFCEVHYEIEIEEIALLRQKEKPPATAPPEGALTLMDGGRASP